MKQFLLAVTLFLSLAGNAQLIQLKKGQKINISNNITSEIDFGMGMMKNSSVSGSVLEIQDWDQKKIDAVYTLARFKTSADMMGQQQEYDSEKQADADNELGKALSEKVGKETKMAIDKFTGKAISQNAEKTTGTEDENDPMSGLTEILGSGDTESAIAESAFFILPAGKKAGDSWTDSINVKNEMKGFKTYTLKSLSDNEAVIAIFSKIDGKQNIEMQGMQMDLSINARTEGEVVLNPKTSLVKKSSRVADVTGNMELMGQSMPLTAKMTETAEFN